MNDALKLREGYADTLFVGTVVTNQDPQNLDRIQVSVPQLYDPDLGDLPWIGCAKDSVFGQGASWGVHGAPAVGSSVIIELQGGDSHYPICTGSLKKTSAPGFASGTNWGFVDPKGNTLNVNLVTGDIKFTASAGVVWEIGADGSLTVTSSAPTTLVAPTINLDGNLNVTGNAVFGGTMKNLGVNVGSTHKHSGVASGSAKSGLPE